MSEQEIIEGRNPVLEALRARRRVYRIWLQPDARGVAVREIRRLAAEDGIPVEEMDGRTMAQRSKTGHPQGVMAQVEAWRYATVDAILARAGATPPFSWCWTGFRTRKISVPSCERRRRRGSMG